MRKIRSDSLFAKLTPEQRSLLFEWLLDEGISYEEAATRCAEQFGLQPVVTSLCAFLKQHGFAWRMDRAKELANDKATKLPKDFDEKKKVALAQREFEKAFHDLSTQEVIALQRLDLDRQIAKTQGEIELEKLKIARVKLEQKDRDWKLEIKKFQAKSCELFVQWSADERAKAILSLSATNKEKIERLGQAMFEDWNE